MVIAPATNYWGLLSAWFFICNMFSSQYFNQAKKTNAKTWEVALIVQVAQLQVAVQAFTLGLHNARPRGHCAAPCLTAPSACTLIPAGWCEVGRQ